MFIPQGSSYMMTQTSNVLSRRTPSNKCPPPPFSTLEKMLRWILDEVNWKMPSTIHLLELMLCTPPKKKMKLRFEGYCNEHALRLRLARRCVFLVAMQRLRDDWISSRRIDFKMNKCSHRLLLMYHRALQMSDMCLSKYKSSLNSFPFLSTVLFLFFPFACYKKHARTCAYIHNTLIG